MIGSCKVESGWHGFSGDPERTVQAPYHSDLLLSREEMSITQKDSPASQRDGGPVISL